MYESYWGLKSLPFQITPDNGYYFPTAMHEEAIKRILYAVHSTKGSFLLTGDVGAGKTIVVSQVMKNLFQNKDRYEVALINHPTLVDCDSFISEMLHQFGIKGDFVTKMDMIRVFHEWLISGYTRGKHAVLIIDEAQLIKTMDILEELRLFSDFQVNNQPLLTLGLVGQSELRKIIQRVRPLNARIAVQYHLFQLNEQETKKYIEHRLEIAGCETKIFTEAAMTEIYKYAGGLPREINKLSDMCLFEGFILQQRQIDVVTVQKVGNEEFIM
ncbi:MAG: hypothetical protein A2520_03140 [Deltaproteobacteria bacterium RIFOXYD12_FULL_53_23]|nr:MAG: hypothetical protein A2520_03140 [Deltaproteobacteria bacterium RIFOXYD12_FULL_53_23]